MAGSQSVEGLEWPFGDRDSRWPLFAQHGPGNRARPNAWQVMVLSDLSGPDGRCAGATDDEVFGALGQWGAAGAWLEGRKLAVIRELIRRRPDESSAGTVTEPGLPGDWDDRLAREVALELSVSVPAARKLVGAAWALEARLPGIGKALDEGRLDLGKARMVIEETSVLGEPGRIAAAERLILDGLAKCRTWMDLQRLVQRAVVTVDPRGAERRREQEERENARVRFWREAAGTCALLGAGLPTDEALQAHARVDQRAQEYRAAGVRRPIDILRVAGYLDLLNLVPAADRIARFRAEDAAKAAEKAQQDSEEAGQAPKRAQPDAGRGRPTAPTTARTQPDAGNPGDATHDSDSAGSGQAGDDQAADASRAAGARADGDTAGDDWPGGEWPGDTRAGGSSGAGGSQGGGARGGPAPDGYPWNCPPDDGFPVGEDTCGRCCLGECPCRDWAPGESPCADCGHDHCQCGTPASEGTPVSHGTPASDQEHEVKSGDGSGSGSEGGSGGGPGSGRDDSSGSGPADGPGRGRGGGPRGAGPGGPGGQGARDPEPAVEAEVNLTLRHLDIPLITAAGLGQRAGEARSLGILDPALARRLAEAAARHPGSKFCLTIVDSEGRAIGHGCCKPLRPPRGKTQRDGRPPPATGTPQTAFTLTPSGAPGPPGGLGSWILALPGQARELTVNLHPVPTGECGHQYESAGHDPRGLLRHLVSIRDGKCGFPACSRHATESDFEHATPHDKGGRTCGCNCWSCSRSCHQVKQSDGWDVEEVRPGYHQWTTPSGRTYTQEPWRYPA